MSSKSSSSPKPEPDELARALAAVEHRGQVRLAQTDKAAEIGVTHAWELGTVARTALRETARLAQLEAELTATAPLAAGRLRLVADVAAVCLAALVTDAARLMLADPWHDEGDNR